MGVVGREGLVFANLLSQNNGVEYEYVNIVGPLPIIVLASAAGIEGRVVSACIKSYCCAQSVTRRWQIDANRVWCLLIIILS